ncbi:MAG: hypothetical protein CMP17_00660 [Rickettsiales bacterium]|nr:hypothetical protein [Rickettsiales bacterium]
MKTIKLTFLIILISSIFFLFGCGSQQDDLPGANIEKISNPDKNLVLEDITALGFKKNKTYKVNDLPDAKSAYYGFLKIPKEKISIDYELRFYENQEKATSIGVEWVTERIGKDAVLTKGDATWKEGVKDARTCGGDSGHGKGYSLVVASSTCNLAKYFDYFIYGNMIILCQGKDVEQSVNNCRLILSKLEPPVE